MSSVCLSHRKDLKQLAEFWNFRFGIPLSLLYPMAQSITESSDSIDSSAGDDRSNYHAHKFRKKILEFFYN